MARSVSELDLLPVDLPAVIPGDGELHLTRHTAVLQRLFPLSPECRRVAQIVAVLDRVRLDDLELVSDVSDINQAAVSSAFDELERRGILSSDAHGVWTLFHPFVADALYDDIGPAERRRVHGLVATHLDARRSRGEAIDLNRLAWHTSQSAAVGDEGAVRILRDAADAIKTTGPVSAADLCERALALLPEPSTLRTEVLSLRVRCLTLAARPKDAVEAGLAALAEMDHGEERARVADGVIAGLFDAGRVEEARQLADREVAAGGASAFLLAQRAMLLAAEGDAGAADEALADVFATPVRGHGEDVLVQSFVASTFAALGRVTEAMRHFDLLRDAAQQARPGMKVYGLTRRCWSIIALGCTGSQEAIAEAEAVIGDVGPGVHSTGVMASKIALDWMHGEWDAALAGAAAVRRSVDMSTVVRRYLQSMEIEIRTARGELREALALVNQPIPGASATMSAWATAGALFAAGDAAGARTLLRGAAERPMDGAWIPHVLSRLVELEHSTGADAAAAEALAALEAHVLTNVDDRPWVQAMLLRSTAIVRRDVQSACESATIASGEGLVYEAALARLVVGTIDLAETECLLAAHDTFGVLGAEGDRRRAAALLRDRGAKVPRRRRSSPGQLTRAEAQIARLVQSGMRNREIARTASYSERTVEVYLSRIYAKLGVSSRLQLARLIDEHGLPGGDDADDA
jgi:DNA-binding CsgD family transcriptional regulator